MDKKLLNRIVMHHKDNITAENGGFRQWEHCYNYFNPKNKDFDDDIACLHLTAYLACWGMYRASAFIKSVDSYFHKPIIQEIRKQKYHGLRDLAVNADPEDLNMAHELFETITEIYGMRIADQAPKLRIEPQKNLDTLVTKVLLGTLACSPAYDRYFVSGLPSEIPRNPKKFTNFERLFSKPSDKEVKKQIDKVRHKILSIEKKSKRSGYKTCNYPDMKILDSYYHLAGKEIEKDKEEKKKG